VTLRRQCVILERQQLLLQRIRIDASAGVKRRSGGATYRGGAVWLAKHAGCGISSDADMATA